MSTKQIVLLPHESSALAAGKLGVLIRVVEPQPRKGHIPTEDIGQWWPLYPTSAGIMQWVADGAFICPFGPPGTVLECREEWAQDWEHNRHFYKADADEDGLVPYLVGNEGGSGGGVGHAYIHEWQPADSMPSWAVRFHPAVGEVRCVRVQEVSEEEAMAWVVTPEPGTYTSDFALHGFIAKAQTIFNSIHGPGSWEADPWVWLATINREGESGVS